MMTILLILFFTGSFVLPVVALVDIVKKDFNGSDKIMWVLIVLFLPIIGSILYFMMGSRQNKIR